MGETIPAWKLNCNPSVSVHLSGRKTSSDGGAALLREIMARSGICEQFQQQLMDVRDLYKIQHSLISQLHASAEPVEAGEVVPSTGSRSGRLRAILQQL